MLGFLFTKLLDLLLLLELIVHPFGIIIGVLVLQRYLRRKNTLRHNLLIFLLFFAPYLLFWLWPHPAFRVFAREDGVSVAFERLVWWVRDPRSFLLRTWILPGIGLFLWFLSELAVYLWARRKGVPLGLRASRSVNKTIGIGVLAAALLTMLGCYVYRDMGSLEDAVWSGDVDAVRKRLPFSLRWTGLGLDTAHIRGDSFGWDFRPLLEIALDRCDKKMAKALIDMGANPDLLHNGNHLILTPLVARGLGWAAYQLSEDERLDMLAFMLDNGSSVNARTKQGESLLEMAIGDRQLRAIELLLKKGADAVSAMPFAIRCRQFPAVELLLAHGVNTDGRDERGNSWLSIAAFADWQEGIDFFRARCVPYTFFDALCVGDIETVRSTLAADSGAAKETFGGRFDERFERVEAGSIIDICSSSLHIAATRAYPAIVERLLANGADVNFRDAGQGTALLRTVSISIDRGSHFHDDHEKELTKSRYIQVVGLLLKAGADANASDGQGHVPLTSAVLVGNEDMAELLAQYGATLDVNGIGRLAATSLWDMARNGKRYPSVRRLLLENGIDLTQQWHPMSGERRQGHYGS